MKTFTGTRSIMKLNWFMDCFLPALSSNAKNYSLKNKIRYSEKGEKISLVKPIRHRAAKWIEGREGIFFP